jgi:hypothetical protein
MTSQILCKEFRFRIRKSYRIQNRSGKKVWMRNTMNACHLNGEECCVDQLWRGHREGGIADNAENCRVRFLFSKEAQLM